MRFAPGVDGVGKGGAPTPFVNAFNQPAVGSLRYNTSQQGQPLPIVYGTQRVSINLLELWDFVGSQGKGGKGGATGGGKSGSGKKSASFSVFVAFGICQGPTSFAGARYGSGGANRVWSNDGIAYGAANTGLNPFTGADGQAPDSTFVAEDPNQPVLGYSGTTYVTGDPLQLGQSPALPNISFEICGFMQGSVGADFPDDANPASIVIDLLTNARYGAGYPGTQLDNTTIADFGVYCQAYALALSMLLDRSQPAARWLEEICTLTVAAPFYTAGLLKIVPYSIVPLSAHGASWTPNLTVQYSVGDRDFIDWGGESDPVIVTRSDPSQATNWFGQEYYDSSNSYNPNISYQFDQGAIDLFGLRSEPVAEAHSITNLTSANASTQLQLQRKQLIRNTFKFQLGWTFALLDPMDIIELTDVNVGLNAAPVRITSIEENDNGELSFEAEELPGIGSAAPVYAMQTPGSQVPDTQAPTGNTNPPIIFEPNAPLSSMQYQAWIIASGGQETQVTSSATASGAVLHFATSSWPTSVAVGWVVEDLANKPRIPAGTVVDAIAIGATTTLVTLSNAVAGGGVGLGDTIGFFTPNWGGCNVWVSTDGSTYTQIGQIYNGARQGLTMATLGAYGGANPDTVNTLSVDLAESTTHPLVSGSAGDAANAVTLCYCDGELLSYETATLTASDRYDLTTLYRGLFGTVAGAHAAGSEFCYIGLQTNPNGVFKYNYAPNLVGTTIYVKLQSFNMFLNETQELAALTPTTYTLTGAGVVSPLNVPFSYNGVPQNGVPVLNYTFGAADNFPLNLTGSVCTSTVAATTSTTFNIAKNGVNFGTMVFAGAASSATFTGTAESFVPGDIITITPSRTDATLATITGNLAGTS